MNVTAVIPIRAGSKGLPGKNTRILAGKPLFEHSIDCAQAAGISNIIVATDIQELLNETPNCYKVFSRSQQSARDNAPTHEVLIDLIKAWDLHEHLIVLLQATSPLRRAETVRAVIDMMNDSNAELGCTVSQIENTVLKSGTVHNGFFSPLMDEKALFTPRQLLPSTYKMDGNIYAFWGNWLINNGSLETNKIRVVQSTQGENMDIDTLGDFVKAEQYLDQAENHK